VDRWLRRLLRLLPLPVDTLQGQELFRSHLEFAAAYLGSFPKKETTRADEDFEHVTNTVEGVYDSQRIDHASCPIIAVAAVFLRPEHQAMLPDRLLAIRD
jgi:hypothetical protein